MKRKSDQAPPSPSPLLPDGDDVYEVKAIVDHRDDHTTTTTTTVRTAYRTLTRLLAHSPTHPIHQLIHSFTHRPTDRSSIKRFLPRHPLLLRLTRLDPSLDPSPHDL